MTGANFYAEISARIASSSSKRFLTVPGGRDWTFGDIDALAAQYAGALIEAGARAGDRIAVQISKSAENVALYLASLRAGLVYLPLNTAYTPAEIDYFIGDARPAIFVCDPAADTASIEGPAIFTLSDRGEGSLSRAAARAAPLAAIADRSGDDLASILYTSGTTGRAKGAMLTHRNLASNAQTLKSLWDIRADDVLLHALPIFHIHGLFVAMNTALLASAEVIFLPKFEIANIRRHLAKASLMMGVPTFYSRLLATPDFGARDCANVRLFISGSAPLTKETFQEFEDRTGKQILERYGMSEAGMIASNPLEGERLSGTVGYALPGVEIRVMADGVAAPTDTPGDIEVRGPNVFKGYWGMPEKTAEEFRKGGWFRTGDIGALSEDGRLTISGRAKDLIIVGGLNVYPKEIEELLDTLPEIAESAVIGIPHADMGEGVVAVLTPAPGAATPSFDALRAACATLARFKQPRKFFFMDALPRNAMGKVQKQALRDLYKDAFNI